MACFLVGRPLSSVAVIDAEPAFGRSFSAVLSSAVAAGLVVEVAETVARITEDLASEVAAYGVWVLHSEEEELKTGQEEV